MNSYNYSLNIKLTTQFFLELLTSGHNRDSHPYYGLS